MLWLCIRLPQLPLAALPPSPPGTPVAVIEQNLVILANAEAAHYGVSPGQSFQTAQGLCALLECRPRQIGLEQQMLHNIALWAYRFSGHVSLSSNQAIVLELSRSLRLFRDLNRLYRRFIRAFRQRQLQVWAALADTPLAAELLSYQNPPLKTLVNAQGELNEAALKAALAHLPVRYLPLPEEDKERLEEMGLHTLEKVLALPRTALQTRFGKALEELLAKALGEAPDPRAHFRPAEHFSSRRYFDSGLNNHRQLRFPIAALLGELQAYLRLRQRVNRDLDWQLDYLDGSREQWRQHLSHSHFDKQTVMALVMLDLERRQLSGPVCGISLHSRHFVSPPTAPSTLFSKLQHDRDAALPQLLDKLQLRLEPGQCVQYLPTDTYLPEQFRQDHLPDRLLSNLQSSSAATPANKLLRPSWLLEPAVPLYEREGKLFWRGTVHLLQGPERIDSQWWQQRQVRDYYIARHEDGRLCWLYRDCLQPAWYLHGFFG